MSVWPSNETVRPMTGDEVQTGRLAPGVMATATATATRSVAEVAVRGDTLEPPQQVTVWGVEGDIEAATGLQLLSGRLFDQGHYARADAVVIVGSVAAATLGVARVDGTATIQIDGRTHLIMGIANMAPGDPALLLGIIVPAGSLQRGSDQVDIAYAVAEPLAVAGVAERFVASMRPNDFGRFTLEFDLADLTLGNTVVDEVRALTAGLLAIGSLVGAVVVSALATASVAERRREMAVRKALGASSVGVGVRFVGEAAFIGVVGSSDHNFVGGPSVNVVARTATCRYAVTWDQVQSKETNDVTYHDSGYLVIAVIVLSVATLLAVLVGWLILRYPRSRDVSGQRTQSQHGSKPWS
ncbi:MAG: ABC transporter permease [Acidimicrobiia bacterium]|nr:ABC transporter permease [Acidimicrobiia bacterium]MDX2467273.1 ABC transporter permease [Acidimicrobiia bacterium]